jgi:acyl-CoA thioesterase FadM
MRFDYEVLSEKGNLLVSGYTLHGCLNSKSKPSRIPSSLKTLVEEKTG